MDLLIGWMACSCGWSRCSFTGSGLSGHGLVFCDGTLFTLKLCKYTFKKSFLLRVCCIEFGGNS